MSKVLLSLIFMTTSLFVQAQATKMIAYIPSDGEMQYYMNLYQRLESIENGQMNYEQLGSMYATFENPTERYYSTYQRLLFESYLLNTKNEQVRKFILDFLKEKAINDDLARVLTRLYQSKPERYQMDSKEHVRYNCPNGYSDEGINLFNMNEFDLFNNQLGLMLFDNDWGQLTFNGKNDSNEKNISLIFGGGTNAINISIRQISSIEYAEFKEKYIDSIFYKKKYKDYQVQELQKVGILRRAGADEISIGIGEGQDNLFPEIEDFSAVLFMYSNDKKIGYQIDYFMNISTKNNNFAIRDRIFNHLLFQSLISFIN